MFRQFSRTMMSSVKPNTFKPANASRALEFGASVASLSAQIGLFVYLNHKIETQAEPHHDDQATKPTGSRY